MVRGHSEIADETGHRSGTGRMTSGAKDCRRVDRDKDEGCEVRVDGVAMIPCHSHVTAEQRLGCRRPEQNEDLRPDERELRLDPRQAGSDLLAIRALVEPPLASGRRPPFEVLDDVGDEDLLTVDAGLCKRLVQESSGRTDERFTLEVLVITGLFADEHPASRHRTLPEDGLGRVCPEIAGLAPGRRACDRLDVRTALDCGGQGLGRPDIRLS